MRKFVKQLNSLLIACAMLVLSCNSFAAIVSDNDGSAFVTKAEFESMKTNFNDQIVKYNESIDGKIDGAIAQYLAGLRLEKKIALDVVYPYVAEWTSSTTASYDNENDKKWKFEATFEQPNYEYWSKFKYLYNNDLYYYTFKKNDNNRYEWKKVQFRLWGTLWFWRRKSGWNDAGYVRWADDFWPSTIKLGSFESKYSSTLYGEAGEGYGYSGVTYPTVYEESYNNYVLAPLSTANTYTYVPNKELLGSLGTIVTDTGNFTRVVDYLSATTIGSFGVYRDMNVNTTYSNVAVTTNTMVLEWLKNYSISNDALKYGVHVCSYDETGRIEFKINCDAVGKIKIGAGKNASDAFGKMKEHNVVVGNNEIKIEVNKNDGSVVFLIYAPTSTSVYGKITSLSAVLITE